MNALAIAQAITFILVVTNAALVHEGKLVPGRRRGTPTNARVNAGKIRAKTNRSIEIQKPANVFVTMCYAGMVNLTQSHVVVKGETILYNEPSMSYF